MKTDIFPYIFGRVGGAPFEALTPFEVPELKEISQAYSDQIFDYSSIKDILNEELYTEISRLKDTKSQNLLLHLKRDLYNDRSIIKYMDHAEVIGNERLNEKLQEYLRSQGKVKKLEAKIDKVYCEGITNSICWLKQLSKHFFLRNGLIFSSNSLYHDLKKFTAKNQNLRKKKQLRLVLSLLRYLTRSVAKTSPFSSYNSIFALEKNDNVFSPVKIGENSSRLSINNLVYFLLKKVLLSKPTVKETLKIFLNPTMEDTNEGFRYFYNEDNNEAFCTVQKSPILLFIAETLDSRKNLTYADLIAEINKASGEEPEQVIKYMDQLLDKGIIVIQFPILLKDKYWPQKLLANLKACSPHHTEQETIEGIISILNNLDETIHLLEESRDADERHHLSVSAYRYFNKQIELLKQNTDIQELEGILKKLSPANLFYEDSLTESVNKVNSQILNESLKKICRLNLILGRNSLKNETRKDFAEKLKTLFGGSRVPLLTFYRDVYLQQNKIEKIVFNYQNTLHNTFGAFFQSLSHHRFEDSIDLYNYLEHEIPDDVATSDVFAQIGNIDGRSTMVVNNILSGAVTNISRFVDLYSGYYINEKIKDELTSVYNGMIVSELVDASIHNSNTFSYLTDHIIDVSLKKHDGKNNICLNELFLCLDDKEHVIIENKEGRRVMPIDFSMESIGRKSVLMKFIDIFNNANSEGVSGLLQTYEQHILSNQSQEGEQVIVIPRLYYSDDIILSRKKWLVKKNFLGQLCSERDPESIQYLAFNAWRKNLKIPDYIFIRNIKANNSHNDHKPQYINLASPILFLLVKNFFSKSSDIIEISEMLPAPQHLAQDKKGDAYVTEHIFNLSSNTL